MVRNILLSCLFTFMTFWCAAAPVSRPSFAATTSDRVRSIKVYNLKDRLSTDIPVIVIGSGEQLIIEFDMLDDERRYLRYEVEHCNADWKPSGLSYVEYLEGFNEGIIENYEYSSATTVPYVHYILSLPNEEIRLKLSGNYLVRIYDENSPERTLLEVRFSVSEQTAPVSAFITSRTDVDINRQHQQLELTVDCERTDAGDLFSEVFIEITQNGRPDTKRRLIRPLRLSGRKLIYEHLPELVFTGGNEYRRFETVSNSWTGMSVDEVEYIAPYYNHFLIKDMPRSSTSYLYDRTLNGGYLVREYNSDSSDIDADYVVVHFALEMPELFGTAIYIDSDAFNRELGQQSEMKYNPETGRYEKAALLKQGAYSYQYVAVPQGTSVSNTATIEGDFYQTGNQYTINVYKRSPGERYDRLIGHSVVYVNQD